MFQKRKIGKEVDRGDSLLIKDNKEEKEVLKSVRNTIKSYLNISLFVEQGLCCCRDKRKQNKLNTQFNCIFLLSFTAIIFNILIFIDIRSRAAQYTECSFLLEYQFV